MSEKQPSAEVEASPSPAAAAPPRRRRSFAPLIIAALIAVIGVAVIGTSTSGGAGMYNYSVADLVSQRDSLAGKPIKVSGRIAADSVRGEPASESFRFDLEDDDGNRVPVGYTRLLPDPFEEGRDAIIQGEMTGGVLKANSLTVKCPSRYADTEGLSDEQRDAYYRDEYKKHTAAQKEAADR